MNIQLPQAGRGRRSKAREAEYQRQLDGFAAAIIELDSRLDFKVSARGWCYILEEHGLLKGDFSRASRPHRLPHLPRRRFISLPIFLCRDTLLSLQGELEIGGAL
jgi:hypothetical protein